MKMEIVNGKVVHKFESFVDIRDTTYQVVIKSSGEEWKGSVYLNGECVRNTLPEADDVLEKTWRQLCRSAV